MTQRKNSGFHRKIHNQTVNDGVAHSRNSRKSAYHVTFDLDLDLENTLDAGSPGDHRVQVWLRSGHLSARRSDLRKSLQTDRRTDRRRTRRHCISSFLEWAKNRQSLKHKVNRWILSLRLNEYKLSASRTAVGKLFQFHMYDWADQTKGSTSNCWPSCKFAVVLLQCK